MMKNRPPYFLLMLTFLLLAPMSCNYGLEKFDRKIIGLWVQVDKEWDLFDDNVHHYYFDANGYYSYMSGASRRDSAISGPNPYELDGDVLTRYGPGGFRKEKIKIKWTPAGKVMSLEYLGTDQKLRYLFLRKKF